MSKQFEIKRKPSKKLYHLRLYRYGPGNNTVSTHVERGDTRTYTTRQRLMPDLLRLVRRETQRSIVRNLVLFDRFIGLANGLGRVEVYVIPLYGATVWWREVRAAEEAHDRNRDKDLNYGGLQA